jgi:hypothetical protein
MLTKDAEPDAKALLTGTAETALATGQARVENHLGSLFDAFDTFSDLVDHTGTISATNVRQPDRDARHAIEDEEIEMIECGAFQPHPDLSHTRFGLWAITEEELVGSTVLFEVESFH